VIAQIKRIILITGDVTVLYAALFMALFFRSGFQITPDIWSRHFLPFTMVYAIWLIILWSQNLYNARTIGNRNLFVGAMLRVLFLNAVIAIFFFYFIPFFSITPKTVLFLVLIFFVTFFTVWRYLYNILFASLRFQKSLLLIGGGETIELIAILKDNPQLGYNPVALLSSSELSSGSLTYLTTQEELRSFIDTQPVETICFSHDSDAKTLDLYSFLPQGIEFKKTQTLYEELTGKVPLSLIQDLWFLENLSRGSDTLYNISKRAFDLVFSLLILIFVIPLWPLVVILIKLEDGGSVFHKQLRIGENNTLFEVIKFRTMLENAEQHGPLWSQENDPRITKIGNILRKTLFDETPQLLLVLAGKMSLVGPRPERKEFVEELSLKIPHYQIRHMVKPGLTGWAQIHFGYGSSTEDAIQKLQYELYYMKNRSLILDLSILLKTINIILERTIAKYN